MLIIVTLLFYFQYLCLDLAAKHWINKNKALSNFVNYNFKIIFSWLETFLKQITYICELTSWKILDKIDLVLNTR